MTPSLEKRLNDCRSLPTLPTIAGEIVRLCKDDNIGVTAVGNLIAKDAALAVKLLSIANSPMFAARSGPATTINQSVSRLGKNAVMALSLSFNLARLSPSRPAAFDYPRFWKRSLTSATAAGCLAQQFKLNREEAFLGGMFQDIGMLALQEAFGDAYAELIAPAGNDHFQLALLEQDGLEIDHREVGAWLVRKWKLPEYLAHTTLASDNPFNHDVSASLEGLVKVVALSGYVADIWLDDDNRASATCQAAECARMWLGMNEDSFVKLLDLVAAEIPELMRLFDKPLGTEGLDKMVAEAREALVAVSLRNALDAEQAMTSVTTLTREKDAAEAEARRDPLTGLYNRRHFDATLNSEFDRARALNHPLSVLFCDVDHFKSVNDKHGHLVGDTVLRQLGKVLLRGAAHPGIAARYGGEEFAVILPEVDRIGAHRVAEQLRALLEQMEIAMRDGSVLRVTASFGCATLDDKVQAATPAALLKIADECVYVAKRTGRNCVVTQS
jgi:diguanylate cyclase (GGDEF)-like protein